MTATTREQATLPPRWAFEVVERERCAYLGCEPNPANVDVMMGNPDGWATYHAWAAYVARANATFSERAVRLLSDAEQLAGDLRAYRDAAQPGPEKSRYRYPLRDIEHAAALIRKAGI